MFFIGTLVQGDSCRQGKGRDPPSRKLGRRLLRRPQGLARSLIALGARRAQCPECGARVDPLGACTRCNWLRRLSAAEWIALLADDDSFQAFGSRLVADPLAYSNTLPFPLRLAQVRAETGVDEAVVAGCARIEGRDVVLVVFDFRFLGGSLGVAAGERIVEALELGRDTRAPVVMLVCSSGARIQEGLPALFQMARTSAAVVALREAAVPFVAVLADPTIGAPFGSCANLADVVLAEQGALIGFAGPRAVDALTGEAQEVRRAEQLAAGGIIDAVIARGELRRQVSRLLSLLEATKPATRGRAVDLLPVPAPARDRWRLVQSLRAPQWPTGRDWLEHLADHPFELVGDRTGRDDRTLLCVLAEIAGLATVVLAQDRLAGPIRAVGYRKALRALRIAGRLKLPVLSLVDTPGAAVGPEADDEGTSYWVAECFAALLQTPVPIVSLVVGQGSSGGALALSIADRIYMLERSIFSIISPEAAAAIVSRDASGAPEWAEILKLSAADAFNFGLIDGVIPGADLGRRARAASIRRVRALVSSVFAELAQVGPGQLLHVRQRRYVEATRDLLHAEVR
jgi:acyl-CoA carboxylase subunit beta